MPTDQQAFEDERAQLVHSLAELGPFRRGSVHKNFRRCGKATCRCRQADHPGHPQYLLTQSVGGKTVAYTLRGPAAVALVEQQVANYHRFRDLTGRLLALNEQICTTALHALTTDARAAGKKGAPSATSSRRSPGKSPRL